MILKTSNPTKLKEFKEILGTKLDIQPGVDLKEVKGTMIDVIKYKALEAGDEVIVEDTILEINGEEIVDIRWKIDELIDGDKVRWITNIGYNHLGYIHIFQGIIEGTITKSRGTKGFAFDPYFLPDNSEMTLAELDIIGKKVDFSARKIALDNLLFNKSIKSFEIKDIPVWTGLYQ